MNLIIPRFRFSKAAFMNMLQRSVTRFEESKVLERILPRVFVPKPDQFLESDDLSALTSSLSTPIYDLLDRGGKRWRPALCFLFADLFNKPHEHVYDVAAIVELIHNGTLIVDDIEDDSEVRRGKPCVHLLYGVDIGINAGNYIYFAPVQYLMRLPLSEETKLVLITICIENMTSVHYGQAWDILWHKSHSRIPTEAQYFRMAEHKTGALAKMAARLSCVMLGQDEKIGAAMANFALKTSIAFQIQDDILNLVGSDKYVNTKGYLGEDVHEGKFSLIMIKSLQGNYQQKLLDILKSKTNDQKLIDEAIEMVQKDGSIDYARKKCIQLVEEAWNEVDAILEESERKENLKKFAFYLIERDI